MKKEKKEISVEKEKYNFGEEEKGKMERVKPEKKEKEKF